MFGKRLRQVRMGKKYTQQRMADLLDLTLGAYQKYEQEERTPALSIIVRIADIFNVPVDYLLGRDEYLHSIGVEINFPEPPEKKKKNKSSKN